MDATSWFLLAFPTTIRNIFVLIIFNILLLELIYIITIQGKQLLSEKGDLVSEQLSEFIRPIGSENELCAH